MHVSSCNVVFPIRHFQSKTQPPTSNTTTSIPSSLKQNLFVHEDKLIPWDGSLLEKVENQFRQKVSKRLVANISENEWNNWIKAFKNANNEQKRLNKIIAVCCHKYNSVGNSFH